MPALGDFVEATFAGDLLVRLADALVPFAVDVLTPPFFGDAALVAALPAAVMRCFFLSPTRTISPSLKSAAAWRLLFPISASRQKFLTACSAPSKLDSGSHLPVMKEITMSFRTYDGKPYLKGKNKRIVFGAVPLPLIFVNDKYHL